MIHRLEEHSEKYSCWRVEDSLLYKLIGSRHPEFPNSTNRWKLVVPKDHRKDILHRCHGLPTSGHLEIYKTFWRIAERYYWPRMRSDVITYVRRCIVCAQSKVDQKSPAGLMGNRPQITQPWQSISLDFVGPFPRSKQGNTYILVVTDYFSKYGIFLVYGAPQDLTCDNGTPMKSKAFQSLCARYKVNLFYTASYYPRADHTERTNCVIKTMLKSYVQYNRTITDRVPSANTEPQHHVQSRVQGYRETYERVSQRTATARSEYRNRYNLRRRPVTAKLAPEFVGPFIIGKLTGTCTYELQDESGVTVFILGLSGNVVVAPPSRTTVIDGKGRGVDPAGSPSEGQSSTRICGVKQGGPSRHHCAGQSETATSTQRYEGLLLG
ncbi:hypothetical protein YQE_06364, partial [Dendroctonus ponderosae]